MQDHAGTISWLGCQQVILATLVFCCVFPDTCLHLCDALCHVLVGLCLPFMCGRYTGSGAKVCVSCAHNSHEVLDIGHWTLLLLLLLSFSLQSIILLNCVEGDLCAWVFTLKLYIYLRFNSLIVNDKSVLIKLSNLSTSIMIASSAVQCSAVHHTGWMKCISHNRTRS